MKLKINSKLKIVNKALVTVFRTRLAMCIEGESWRCWWANIDRTTRLSSAKKEVKEGQKGTITRTLLTGFMEIKDEISGFWLLSGTLHHQPTATSRPFFIKHHFGAPPKFDDDACQPLEKTSFPKFSTD